MSQSVDFVEQRLGHFTWAWFTVPMSTGGIALILGQLPYRFPGLDTIGLVFYMTDVFLFFCIMLVMILRYTLTNARLLDTLQHPIESLFLPTCQLAFATLIMGMSMYSQPHINLWCKDVLLICFWIYAAIATIQAPIQYVSLFAIKNQRINHTTRNLTPGILLPIFPSMLVGAVASSVSRHQNQVQAFNIAIAGLAFQGLGIMITCFFYALILRKLMQFGLPEPSHRTGLFILAGPPGFCGLALLGMARNASNFLPTGGILGFSSVERASDILLVMGLITAIFLWQLSAFWWLVAAISFINGIRSPNFHFSMSWWAAIFPISGFCVVTIYIGQVLKSKVILWFATGMAIYLVIAYFCIMAFMIQAILTKKIMWDGRDEDKEVVPPEFFCSRHDSEAQQQQQQQHLDSSKSSQLGESDGHAFPESCRAFSRASSSTESVDEVKR